MEKALFPMKYLKVTQGMNGSYSHQGTENIDVSGKDSGIDNVFAPFTGVIKRIYTKNANVVWLESLNPVKYADGTEDYMTVMFMHDNDVSDLWAGKVIHQGEVFYQEGKAGQATGNHVQLSVSRGKFNGTGWHENEYGHWEINNEINPTKALWLRKDTIIMDDGGYNWKLTDTDEYMPTTNQVAYIVKKSDTLVSIANKYGIDWQDLYSNNQIVIGSNPSLLKEGQILIIPNYTSYTIIAGDNLLKIAKKFDTTWEQIYSDNKDAIGSSPNNIKVGQKLVIRI